MAEENLNAIPPEESDPKQVPVDVLADSFMQRLRNGERPPVEFTRPEVAEILIESMKDA